MPDFGILTVSTSCAQFPEKDIAGPKLENEINHTFPNSSIVFKGVVTDDIEEIVEILEKVCDGKLCDILFTVGGTGFAASDVTPEATKIVIDREAPGLTYAMVSRSLVVTDLAMLSRSICGIKNKTIIINFPGSAKAVVECFSYIKGSLLHAVELVTGNTLKVGKTHEILQQNKTDRNEFGESKVKIKTGLFRCRKSIYPMVEVADAKKIMFKTLRGDACHEFEIVSLDDSLDKVLAKDIRAPCDIPSFPASIKDGYAVRAADGAGERKVRTATAAGDQPITTELEPGEIVRISTGAAVPFGADAVVQIEDTVLIETKDNGEEENIVEITVAPKIGQDIRKIGSDIQANTVVLEKYHPITAAYIGVLAMLGICEVPVFRRPSIGIISTGNELRDAKEPLKPGQIHDANKIALISLLKTYGYKANDCGIARDTPNSVKYTLGKAFQANDFVISSGGVSMGEHDLLKQILIEDFNAEIHFGRINMKPGKPTVFSTLNYNGRRKIVFSLPGNPVSCCVTSLLFVIPALKHMEHDKLFNGWPQLNVTLEHSLKNNDSRPEYVRVVICKRMKDSRITASSTGNQISSRLNSMVNANGLLLVPGKTTFESGSVQIADLFGKLFQKY